ncbi:rhogef domain-containing protein [Fusarium sporotrichioides]|uniref:Rhogef domain-containing protein n=1 Tax=Fusarium sporotrichioides TaxID=5514 RepID=A0A395RRK2_FUSSP|nr:rhogef domain-containing protein [Fusarium sporotrichioides]
MDCGSETKDTTKAQPKDNLRLIRRQNVIQEIIDTEMAFLRDMRILLLVYKGTADACPALDPLTIQIIFRNISYIVSAHTAFQSQLKKSVASSYYRRQNEAQIFQNRSTTALDHRVYMQVSEADDQATRVGHAFKFHIGNMAMVLEEFLKSHDQVTERLAVIRQDPMILYWLEQCKDVTQHLTHAWDLDSLLIKPVQRVTRYPLLISELLRHTPPDHPDRKDLQEAKDLLNMLLFEINTKTRGFETTPKIAKGSNKSNTKRSGMQALRKSMTKIRGWSRRLGRGDKPYIDDNRNFSSLLDNISGNVTTGDSKFSIRQQWSQSVPDLFRTSHI